MGCTRVGVRACHTESRGEDVNWTFVTFALSCSEVLDTMKAKRQRGEGDVPEVDDNDEEEEETEEEEQTTAGRKRWTV